MKEIWTEVHGIHPGSFSHFQQQLELLQNLVCNKSSASRGSRQNTAKHYHSQDKVRGIPYITKGDGCILEQELPFARNTAMGSIMSN